MSYEEGVSRRKERIRLLHKMIGEDTTGDIEKVLGKFCCETGVSLYTARSYLKVLIQAGLVEAHESKV
jgi:DNA-binding transcriptional ArsR family regulator